MTVHGMNRRGFLRTAMAAGGALALGGTIGTPASAATAVIDTRWPTVNGRVLAVTAYPGASATPTHLLVGGHFDQVTTGLGRKVAAQNLFAVSLSNPETLTIRGTASPVWSLAAYGKKIVVGTGTQAFTAPYFTGTRTILRSGSLVRGVAVNASYLAVTEERIGRLTIYGPNSSVRTITAVGGGPRALLFAPNGALYVGGWFNSLSGSGDGLAKLAATGNHDPAFDMNLLPFLDGTNEGDYMISLATGPKGLIVGSGGHIRNMVWYVDYPTGTKRIWPGNSRGLKSAGDVQAVTYAHGRVVFGNHRNHANNSNNLANQFRFTSAIDPTIPAIDTSWDPGLWGNVAPNEGDNGGVQGLAYLPSIGRLAIGGSFFGYGDHTAAVAGSAPPGTYRQGLVFTTI